MVDLVLYVYLGSPGIRRKGVSGIHVLSISDVSGRLPVKTIVTKPSATWENPSERAKYTATKSEGCPPTPFESTASKLVIA